MKKNLWQTAALCTAIISVIFTGCQKATYDGFVSPAQGESSLKPVDSCYIEQNYQDKPAAKEETLQTFSSENNLCVIEKKKSYYNITLDLEKGSHYAVGKAYGETIVKQIPEYPSAVESYLYENIRQAFAGIQDDYTALEQRLDALKNSLDQDYQQEIEGFAEAVSGNTEKGFHQDGKLSYQEAMLIHMVPDALRPTACSSISVNGNKTKSGHRITSRIMEWSLGSENQLANYHCVTHFKNADKSFTSVGSLGMLDVITAINDNGVMMGCHDVGTNTSAKYTYKNKTCYSYGFRYALENYATAKEAGDYLIKNSRKYTYSSNALISDANDVFCAEMCVNTTDGRSVLRSSNTALNPGLEWTDPNTFCIVNSFVVKGNQDQMTATPTNLVRWEKYKKLFSDEKEITLNRFKELLTSEKTIDSPIIVFRNNYAVYILIADYDTKTIQAYFVSPEGPTDEPEFINLGKY